MLKLTKSGVLVACLLVASVCGAEEFRVYPTMPGGSFETFAAAYSDKIENRCWRWCMYLPRECVYEIPELNKTFRFVMTQTESGSLVGTHIEETPNMSIVHKHDWVLPAGWYNIKDESAQGVGYKTGKMGEAEKFVRNGSTVEHYFKGFVLIDGRVYSPWCRIESPVRLQDQVAPLPPAVEPSPIDEPSYEPILPRNPGLKKQDPVITPELPAPEPLTIPAPTSTAPSRKRNSEQKEEPVRRREPVARR